MPDTATPLPEPPAHERLTDAELHRLQLWAQRSTLPAWRDFDPAHACTPAETIQRLIAERTALRAVLETVTEFHGSVAEVMQRLGVGT